MAAIPISRNFKKKKKKKKKKKAEFVQWNSYKVLIENQVSDCSLMRAASFYLYAECV
jgi:hypothetical protein